MDLYTGTIIEESLSDNRILNDLNVRRVKITDDADLQKRWHLYTVRLEKSELLGLGEHLKDGPWYMHFWHGNKIIAVFKLATFEFSSENGTDRQKAIDYGIKQGIPEGQLDFLVEHLYD